MLLALVQLALGSQCIIGPSRLVVDAGALHTGGALSVWVVGGRGALPAHLASRLRLRGPDDALVPVRVDHLLGEVRLTPVGGLRPGTYLLLPDDLHPRSDVKPRTVWGADRRVGEEHGTPEVYPTKLHRRAA